MQDPYLILDVAEDAADEDVHRAYLAAVRRWPAEQEPERFQSIRQAYETLRTKRLRLEYALFNTETPTARELLERLSGGERPQRPDIDRFRELLCAAPRKSGG